MILVFKKKKMILVFDFWQAYFEVLDKGNGSQIN